VTRRIAAAVAAFALAVSGLAIHAQSAKPAADDRAADRAAIRAHIESIFQAFIDGDINKIYATHSEDWRGFLEGSRAPIKGIDEYMKANGIAWPQPAPGASLTAPPAPPPPSASAAGVTRGYAVSDFDVQFYGPDLAVACFFGEFNRTANGTTTVTNRLRIMDVYGRRNGQWIQVASHTIVDPVYQMTRNATPIPTTSLPPVIRQQVLDAREAIWRAYFTNDQATLEKLIPDEAIAISEGSDQWDDRAAILAGAKRFAASGARLVSLEFPKTEMQVYGSGTIVFVYTTYRYDLDTNGVKTTATGRGTEMFVRRGGAFLNAGWHLDRGK
jgi:ketosteroid isomerase-like protein